MESPPGFTDNLKTVKRLHKSLYGLKQAGCGWYETLTRALHLLDFKVAHADPSVFIACVGSDILLLAVHVDDCVLTGGSSLLITDYKQCLHNHYCYDRSCARLT